MDATSTYHKDFKIIAPLPSISKASPHQSHLKMNPGTFTDNTINKDSYKNWKSQPSAPFKELPVFTGSILYPSNSHELQTTNMNTFKGTFGPKADPFTLNESNIKLEGSYKLKRRKNKNNTQVFKQKYLEMWLFYYFRNP